MIDVTLQLARIVQAMPPVPASEVLHVSGQWWIGFILWCPLISLVLCGLCAACRVKSKLPAWITVFSLAISFVLTLLLAFMDTPPERVELFKWINVHWDGGSFVANFAFYIDSLTILWMSFVTGLGALIALYASEYMEPDVGRGYARFFAGISAFLFAMICLVMGDNLLMLYLGWEGVGFASYWLIGYYYQKPEAVAAAKKAFIVNRIGDLGLALAIYLIWSTFGTIQYNELITVLDAGTYLPVYENWSVQAIPYLLMLAAFGKSAQLPLYVWLPDAMEGPTPVSALIHAATMVTAGVYLIARMYPFFLLAPESLHVVAWVGGLTALLAATIGMAPVRHQAHLRLFNHFTIGVHVPGTGRPDDLRCGIPRLHACLLQGCPVPDLWSHHAWIRRPVGSSEDFRTQEDEGLAHCFLDHVHRLPLPCRVPLDVRVLLEGRDPRRGLRLTRSRIRGTRLDGNLYRVPDGLLHLPCLVPGLCRGGPLRTWG